jgi:hypothetical protein
MWRFQPFIFLEKWQIWAILFAIFSKQIFQYKNQTLFFWMPSGKILPQKKNWLFHISGKHTFL